MSLSVESGSDDRTFGDSPSQSKASSNSAVQFDFAAIKAHLSGFTSYITSRVTMDTVRPLNMFLGISGPSFCLSPDAFNPPIRKVDKSTPEKFKSRLKLNFAFFLSNYAVVTAGVALVTALMHPSMLVALGLLWALWGFHTFLISNEVVLFGRNIGTLVSISHRANALVVVTTAVIVWKCLIPAITVVAISGLLIFAHAMFRDPKHIDTSDQYRRGGSDDDDSGEDSHDSEVLVDKPGQV
ncbi:PRA1 family protein [Nitzschia inconspicua]|uniref:PRA1 family protein n=1 Tax=Nitzschia inconspicua TaxID=303405 RepID=A0A9K3PJA2_9STRA|nr:PRA1 family protein [Nitzschia inconspicua]